MAVTAGQGEIEKFIARCMASSGAERANFQLFAFQLCRIASVEDPEPAKEDGSLNGYTIERTVSSGQHEISSAPFYPGG